jgi:drug/metabolite transporter (DMT)-like permease
MPARAETAVHICTGAIAVGIVATGWFYTFRSRAAAGLADIERDAINHRRVRLRRLGGWAMMALGIGFFAGFNAVTPKRNPGMYDGIWIAVCLLLILLLILTIVDLRLTMKLRRPPVNRPPDIQ